MLVCTDEYRTVGQFHSTSVFINFTSTENYFTTALPYMKFWMCIKLALQSKSLTTHLAHKSLFLQMNSHVGVKGPRSRKLLPTFSAWNGIVSFQMLQQRPLASETSPAGFTDIHLFDVNNSMTSQVLLGYKTPATDFTLVWLLLWMHHHVFPKFSRILATDLANER